MLRIFSDRSQVPAGVFPPVMLYPFWGNPWARMPDPVCGDFVAYERLGATLFKLVSLDEAEVAVLPVPWEATGDPGVHDAALAFAQMMEAAGKPLIVFYVSDSEEHIPLRATVFRTSLSRGTRGPGEFALPAWNEDIVAHYCHGRLPVRLRPARPVVGFCGQVPRPSRRDRLWGLLGGHELRDGIGLRRPVLDALSRSTAVIARVIARGQFFGDAQWGSNVERQVHRGEFVANLLECDYALCVRGMGNFSYRLYEALCCGRIPVIVDTECVLPFDGEIDWRAHAIWVRPEDIGEIGDRVAAFNAALSERDFRELQHRCRRLWEERMSPQGFFRHLHQYFLQAPVAPPGPQLIGR